MTEEKEELIQKLTEEHENDFAPDDTSSNNQGNDDGGDNSQDNPEDAYAGTNDSPENSDPKQDDIEDEKNDKESQQDTSGPVESDDSDQPGTEQLGEKKDANSRIRQLIEERKAAEAEKAELEKKLAEREEAERKAKELEEDPIYKVEDFIGTLDEEGNVLTDNEAKARFKAWESDYRLRQYQKAQVLKEAQNTLISLQRETADAFSKFPEFNRNSEDYDPELGSLANEMFAAGLIYQNGHEGDNNYIIGSRVAPHELLEKLHDLRSKESTVTKVNNLSDDSGPVISSQQVNKRKQTYAPGFRGEVDKEIDKIMKGRK